MARTLVINGVNYEFPETGDAPGWGDAVTGFADAVSQHLLQKTGGVFTLTADVNFGANFGLVSRYFKSRTADISQAGQVRLAHVDSVAWRNFANDGNLLLTADDDDDLEWNAEKLATRAWASGEVATKDEFIKLNDTPADYTGDAAKLPVVNGGESGLEFAFLVDANVDAAAAIAYSKLNLVDSVVNADISASAAIARSKVAVGTADHVLINDGTGALSSEAALAKVRGGTGADNSSVTFPTTGTVVTREATETFTGVKTFDEAISLTELSAAPATPSAGTKKVYAKDDGKVYQLGQDGLEKPLGGGAGSGEINYIDTPDDAGSWSTSDASALTVTTTTTESEIPRFPFVDTAIKITPAGSATGAYVFTNVEIGDADMGKLLKIEWAQSVGSAFTSSDYLLEVRPATDDTFSSIGSPIPLAQWDGDDEYKIDALPGQLATFVPTSKWVQVRIVKDSSTDDANAWISLNTVTVGPSKNLVGPTITKSETYTPALTNFGTVSTNTGIYNRSGSYLDLDVFIVTTGSGSGGTVTVGLPSGLTIDTARLSGGASNNSSVGSANFFRSSTHIAHTPVAGTSTGNGIGLLEEGVATLVTGPDIASGQVIRINARLPILEWRDTGVTRMLTPNELYQSAQVKYRVVNSSVAVSAGATVPYDVEDSTLDKVGDWSNTGGVITFNQPGRYVVRAKLFTTAPTTPAAGAGNLSCQVDSGSGFETRFLGITNGTREIIATDVVNVKRGNQLRMIATALTIDALLHNTLTIARIPDRTEGSPIGVALATSEHAGLVELSDDFIANSSRPGLMPIFEQFTINLTAGTSDFSAGSAVLTKVGNLITLCSLTATVNSSLANPTASGAIPSGYRPSEVKSNCMIGSDTVLRFVQVDTSGNLSVYAKNYSGTTINNVGTVAYWSLQWTI